VSPGAIGFSHDWNIPLYPEQIQQWFQEYLYVWYDLRIFGSYPFVLTSTIFRSVIASFWFLGGEVITKGFTVFILFLTGFGMYYTGKTLKIGALGSFIAGTIYMLNPVVFNYLVEGLGFIVGYAISPFAFSFFLKSAQNKNLNMRLTLLGGLLFAIAMTSIQFSIMLSVLLIAYSLFTSDISNLVRRIKVLFAFWIISFLINASWILAGIYTGTFSTMEARSVTHLQIHSELARARWLSPELGNVIRLVGYPPAYFLRVVGVWPGAHGIDLIPTSIWTNISFLIPIFVFSAILIKPRSKEILFFTLLSLVSLFFAKGTNPPFESIFVWLYLNLPLTIMFRDPYRLTFLLAFGYAVLIGSASEGLSNILDKLTRRGKLLRRHSYIKSKRVFSSLVLLLMICSIFLYSWPFLAGIDWSQPLGGLQTYRFEPEYYELYKQMSMEQGDFRVAFLPTPTVLYNNLTYPGIDPLMDYWSKPTIGSRPYYGYTPFLAKTFYTNRTKYLGYLLGLANIKYVVMREDFRSLLPRYLYYTRYPEFDESWTNQMLNQVLQNQADLKLNQTMRGDKIRIYENEHLLPHLYAVDNENSMLIAGDLSAYVSLSYMKPILDEENETIATFFASQHQLSQERTLIDSVDTVAIQDGQYFDYVSAFIQEEYKIDLGSYSRTFDDAQEGWISSRIWWWYDWDYVASLENGIFTQSRSKIDIPYLARKSEQHDVWVKIYFGDRGTHFSLSIGSDWVRIIQNDRSNQGFKWVYLGSVYLEKGNQKLVFESLGGENVIANMVVAPSRIFAEALERADTSIQKKNLLLIYESEKFQLNIPKRLSLNDTEKWLFSLTNVENYDLEMEDGIWNMTIYFDGNRTEGEGVISSYQLEEPMNLFDYPLLELKYHIQDPDVQTVAIEMGIDYSGDGKKDAMILGAANGLYERPAPVSWNVWAINAYEFARKLYPNKQFYNLVEIRVIPHSLWGSDRSTDKQGSYSFYFDELLFSRRKHRLDPDASQGFSLMINFPDKIVQQIFVPRDGEYDLFIRSRGEPRNGRFMIQIESETFPLSILNSSFYWHKIEKVYLTSGYHNVTFVSEEEIDPIVITDDNQTAFWHVTSWGNGTIGAPALSDDAETKTKGTSSLKIVVGSATKSHWVLRHDFATYQDWSGKESFSFSWHGNNTGASIRLFIRAPDLNNTSYHEFIDDFSGWKRFVFPINKFIVWRGSPNWSKVKTVHFEGKTKGLWFLDRVIVDVSQIYVDLDQLVVISVDRESKNPANSPKITYEKINPTRYVIHVNADKPFFLIFGENYDPFWMASCGNEEFEHFGANFFGNGYYINKTGKFDVTLEFTVQRYYEYGLVISFATIIVCVLFILYPKFRIIVFRSRTKSRDRNKHEIWEGMAWHVRMK